MLGLLSWFHSDRTHPEGRPNLEFTPEHPYIWPWCRKGTTNEMRITISRDGSITWARAASREAWIPRCRTPSRKEVRMKRINRIIELLEQGQPVYWAGGTELSYEGGVESAQTSADWLVIGIEHGPYDISALNAFMRGLVAGGPPPTGHLTPPVIVTLPFDGTDETVVRTNAWMIKQVLATGIHGILLCHAETPGAVKAFVEWSRYPFQTLGVGEGLDQGRRGSGGQDHAASIWGLSTQEYLQKADVWPLNPEGELLLGLKIENKRALANVEASTKIPGIGFAEWGPSDMRMTFGYGDVRTRENTEEGELKAARNRVFAACKAANIGFLDAVYPDDVVEKIKEGVTFPAGAEESAVVGRKYTNRIMP